MFKTPLLQNHVNFRKHFKSITSRMTIAKFGEQEDSKAPIESVILLSHSFEFIRSILSSLFSLYLSENYSLFLLSNEFSFNTRIIALFSQSYSETLFLLRGIFRGVFRGIFRRKCNI